MHYAPTYRQVASKVVLSLTLDDVLKFTSNTQVREASDDKLLHWRGVWRDVRCDWQSLSF
jgi:hypothetical protein